MTTAEDRIRTPDGDDEFPVRYHARSEPQEYDPTPVCVGCHKPWTEFVPSDSLDPCPESVRLAKRRPRT